ncbi:conserved hypothetical protein [Candidatus Zixiibacteriota bacterium]|nr:conserved hypothetical protein [candidate division Zixibacteria bacterium]
MLGTPKKTDFILAEFSDPAALIEGAKKMRDAGYKKFDCHSPFPIHGMDRAMGLKRSPIGWIAGLWAIIGAGGGLALQWYAMSVSYPLVIAGKPYFAFQAYVPVTFAFGVLGGAFASLFGMLIINRLPRLNHPLFNSERFKRLTVDAFFISLESDDPLYDESKSPAFLESAGGKNIEILRDE